jgi:DNA invertase Pin-like site-specific DNA recombinase
LDRWAISSSELILEVNELIKKGVGFISYSENLDFTTASGKLHFNILCVFADFEKELIRERTIEGLNRVRLKGKLLVDQLEVKTKRRGGNQVTY